MVDINCAGKSFFFFDTMKKFEAMRTRLRSKMHFQNMKNKENRKQNVIYSIESNFYTDDHEVDLYLQLLYIYGRAKLCYLLAN